MEQQRLCLAFLDIMINKDAETTNIFTDIFIKKSILGDVFHLTLFTTSNAERMYYSHLPGENAS